jgi:hypothetical protein
LILTAVGLFDPGPRERDAGTRPADQAFDYLNRSGRIEFARVRTRAQFGACSLSKDIGRCVMQKLCKAIVFSSLVFAFTPNVGFAQTFEPGVDRPGADFSNFNIPGRGPHTCQSACLQNGDCRAWTYVRAGFQGPVARCWLKSGVPEAQGNPCCVSGIVPR